MRTTRSVDPLAGRCLGLLFLCSVVAGCASSTRLDRDSDLQRLVLVLTGRFSAKQSVLSPEAAKIFDAVKDLLPKYPTYPVQITGFTDDQGAPADLAALSLERTRSIGRS